VAYDARGPCSQVGPAQLPVRASGPGRAGRGGPGRAQDRELDYFEQLGALERHSGFDFELIKTLLGRRLIDRWELWQPSIDAIGGTAAYPNFERLVAKMRTAL
jgi:hypothetical protein